MEIFLENNFMCLVTLWKCYFPRPPPQNPPPHNRKTTKTPPPTPPPQQQQNQRYHKQILLQKFQTRTRTNRCEWVHRCEWVRGASGLVGVGRCDDLSTLSVSLFARGLEMVRRSRWSVTGFDKGGFEWSERCDHLAPMWSSCSDISDLLALSLSLSLLFSKAGNHLKWKWKRKWFSIVLALIFGQLEMLFSLTEFEVTTKHPIFRKIISGISWLFVPCVMWTRFGWRGEVLGSITQGGYDILILMYRIKAFHLRVRGL